MENINYVTEDELHSSETQSFLVQVDEPSLVISRNRVIFVFAVATFTIAVIVIVIVILVTSSSGGFILKYYVDLNEQRYICNKIE